MLGNKFFVLFLFLLICGINSFASQFSDSLVFPEKSPKVFRILLFGPGLSSQDLKGEMMPSAQLEKRLNRNCAKCFEVVNASVPGLFLSQNIQLYLEIQKRANADLVVYFESGTFLAAEMFSVYQHEIDSESENPVRKSENTLKSLSCCRGFFSIFPISTREKIGEVLNYLETFREARRNNKRDLIVLLDPVFQMFGLFGAKTAQVKSRFLVLLQPHGFKPDEPIFPDSLFQQILFKSLIYFYAPQRTSIERVFANQGFRVEVFPPESAQLYQSQYLSYRHTYNLNANGAEVWAQYSAKAIKNFLNTTRIGPNVR